MNDQYQDCIGAGLYRSPNEGKYIGPIGAGLTEYTKVDGVFSLLWMS